LTPLNTRKRVDLTNKPSYPPLKFLRYGNYTASVLNSPKDWYQWYIALENFADAKGIWDYVNPESETYKYLERRYHDERAEFRLLRDALEKLVEHLFKTVNSRYMTISLGGQSLGRDPKKIYNLLKKLRKRYAPTDDTRRHDIQRKYDNLRRVPRQSKETWIEDCIQTVEEMVELDLKTALNVLAVP